MYQDMYAIKVVRNAVMNSSKAGEPLSLSGSFGAAWQAEFVAERPATAIYARVLRNVVSLSASAAGAERGVRPAANGRLRTDPRDDRAGGGL